MGSKEQQTDTWVFGRMKFLEKAGRCVFLLLLLEILCPPRPENAPKGICTLLHSVLNFEKNFSKSQTYGKETR